MKYVVVSGGVLSGLGKGVTANGIGAWQKCWFTSNLDKNRSYLNSDAGTMSPFEHGEVFVLDDGGEVDLDLGNYERFLDINLQSENNLTTGKYILRLLRLSGLIIGKTFQVIPHITDAIQDWIEDVSKKSDGDKPPDACVIELGGTVGDIESAPFIEHCGNFNSSWKNICFVHVSLVPVMGPVGEQKTKPTQHSVKELRVLESFRRSCLSFRNTIVSRYKGKKLLNFVMYRLKQCLVHMMFPIFTGFKHFLKNRQVLYWELTVKGLSFLINGNPWPNRLMIVMKQ